MTLRYFGRDANREGVAGLQLLGRYAILANVAEGTCPLAVLPGASPPPPPSVPVRDTEPAPPPELTMDEIRDRLAEQLAKADYSGPIIGSYPRFSW